MMDTQTKTDATPGDSPTVLPGRASAGLGVHALWLGLFIAAFAPTILWLWHRWTRSIWENGHGVFIPLIVGWLVYEQLKREKPAAPESSAWGFVFLIPGLAMLVLDTAIQTGLMAAAGLVVCLPGLSLLLLGARRTRALTFPLLLATLMLPIPAGATVGLHLALREISAWGAAHFVSWIGIPVVLERTTMLIPRGYIEVSDVCSGIQTFYASITLALILAYLTPSNARRAVILVCAPFLAIACNMIRITGLVVLAQYFGFPLLDTALHETSGLISFAMALTALFLIADRSALRGARG